MQVIMHIFKDVIMQVINNIIKIISIFANLD